MREYPILDIDTDYVIGTGIDIAVLNLYRNYPCCLKATVIVLCRGGKIEGLSNLNKLEIKKNDILVLPAESIIQIESIEASPDLYVMVFSSKFINGINFPSKLVDCQYLFKAYPIVHLREEEGEAFEDFFKSMLKFFSINKSMKPEITGHMLLAILYKIVETAGANHDFSTEPVKNKGELICKKFYTLALQYYATERNISFYAGKLNITPTYLSITVKNIMGRTVMDIIARLVINDAKSKLKSTDMPINKIAESLNFANASFFGKYFKRHVGIGPLAYRSSDRTRQND